MNEKKDEKTPDQFENSHCRRKISILHSNNRRFFHWVTDNMMSSIDVKKCTSILEDFVKSNEHIIQRINIVRSSLP